MGIRQLQRPKAAAKFEPAVAAAAVVDAGEALPDDGGPGSAKKAAKGDKGGGKGGGGKGGGKKGASIRTSKQLSATVAEAFFCITCCEQRQAPYPFQW